MHKRIRLILPTIILLSLAGFGIWRITANREISTAGTVSGNGVIEATETDISAKVSGKIIRLAVHEGDDVHAGQLIALLDSGELVGQVTQSQGNLQAAEANYAELTAGTRSEDIERARAQYTAAQDAVRQAMAHRDLVYTGTRPEQVAQLRAALKQAQANLALVKEGPRAEQIAQLRAAYNQAQAQLALVQAGPRDEEIAQLRAAVSQAQANLDEAESNATRVQKLFSQGAVASRQVEQAVASRDVARAAYSAAQQRLLEAKNGARPQEIQQVQAAVELARQRLQEALAGARPQELQSAQAAVDAANQRLAEAEHGARPQERMEADAQLAQAQAQQQAAKAALDLAVAGPRKESLDAAKAKVNQARGSLQTADASERQTIITAPTDGRVTLRNVEPGEMVTPGLPIVRVAQLRRVWIRVYVSEETIGRIKVGERASVTTDAFPQHRFTGKVIEVAQEPEFTPKNVQTKEERVKLVYGIKIEVENPDNLLKPGMPGDAVIFVK